MEAPDLTIGVDLILWLMLLVMACTVIWKRDLISAAVCLSIYSLITAGLFLSLDAPDVAITEAAIGSAISLLFFLATFRVINKEERPERNYVIPGLVVCGLLCLSMFVVMGDMPKFGWMESPANSYLGKYYAENTLPDTGVPNAVTSVLASYRGFDTLGETYVILCAVIAVLLILPGKKDEEIA